MRKLFIVSTLLVFSFVSCEDTSAQSLTHHSIEGIWSIFPDVVEIGEEGFHRFNLSWGRRGFPRIVDIVVDLHSDPEVSANYKTAAFCLISDSDCYSKCLKNSFFAPLTMSEIIFSPCSNLAISANKFIGISRNLPTYPLAVFSNTIATSFFTLQQVIEVLSKPQTHLETSIICVALLL